MIVHYLDVVGISTLPFKTDAPLIVNADTVLSLSVARQFFEAIRRRYVQILQDLGSVQNLKFPSSNLLDTLRKLARELAIEYSSRFSARESLDHRPE